MADTTGLSRNHFALFALPETFEVDVQQLTARYRDLQRAVHPDRFAHASDQERRIAMQKTAQLNEAYQVLKQPISRARYLLELRGVSFNDERDTKQDPAFLMEQMELREQLESIRSAAEPLNEMNALLKTIAAHEQTFIKALADHLNSDAEGDQQAAKAVVHKLQFMQKLRQEAEDLEAALLDAI